MQVLKQLAVHNVSAKFSLPIELSHEILGFCFYDTVTALGRAVHKSKMTKINVHFEEAFISRANPGRAHKDSDLLNDHNNSEMWEINLARNNQEPDEEVLFQANNCRTCGNYKICWTYIPTAGEQSGYDINQVCDVRFWLEAIPIPMRCGCLLQT